MLIYVYVNYIFTKADMSLLHSNTERYLTNISFKKHTYAFNKLAKELLLLCRKNKQLNKMLYKY